MALKMCDEEVASKIIQIYFREIARLGYKRGLKLDEVINAYYYVLSKLERKDSEMEKLKEKVEETEEELKTE